MTTSSIASATGRVCATCALLLCMPASGRLSEPSNICFGQASDVNGLALTSGAVIARVNGIECARGSAGRLLADSVNFSLQIPLDDGADLRFIPTAARTGERVELCLLCNGDEIEVTGIVPLIAEPGALLHADIQAVPEPGAALAAAVSFALLAIRRRTGTWPAVSAHSSGAWS